MRMISNTAVEFKSPKMKRVTSINNLSHPGINEILSTSVCVQVRVWFTRQCLSVYDWGQFNLIPESFQY